MPDVIGVRFHGVGKAYDFATGDLKIRAGDTVIVQTVNGLEIGLAAGLRRTVAAHEIKGELKPVVRKADAADLAIYSENLELEKEAYKICRERVDRHNLEMNIVNAEYTFDRKKVVFYFTSEGRVDFRELVKDLAQIFHVRIELRQIGVRDEARMIGGLGICGRELCCASFMQSFNPVSIKMAKDQGLSMNPAKISGCCGRLMCCLQYEHGHYKDVKRALPSVKSIIDTPDGKGRVISQDILREEVGVVLEDDPTREIRVYTKSDLGLGECQCPARNKGVRGREIAIGSGPDHLSQTALAASDFAVGAEDATYQGSCSGTEESTACLGSSLLPESGAADGQALSGEPSCPDEVKPRAEKLRKELVLGKAGLGFVPGAVTTSGPAGSTRANRRRTDRRRKRFNARADEQSESVAERSRRSGNSPDRTGDNGSRRPSKDGDNETYFGKKKKGRGRKARRGKRQRPPEAEWGGRKQGGFRAPRTREEE